MHPNDSDDPGRRQLKRIAFAAVLLLILQTYAAHAADDGSALGSFFDETVRDITSTASDFGGATSASVSAFDPVLGAALDAFRPASCGEVWPGGPGAGPESVIMWFAPALLAAIVVILGVTIVYMLGQLLSSPSLVALSKEELQQSGVTIVRVLFLFGGILAGNTWYTISTSNAQGDPIYSHYPLMIDAAMAFARQMVSDMITHYSMLVMYNMVVHTIYSSTMWIGVTWRAMFSFNLGPVLRPIIDILSTTLQFLSLGLGEWLLHVVTLCFIKRTMFAFFIPVGILLRALPYTRSAGEALFALSFSLVLFYPFMFLMDYEVHKIMKYNIADSKTVMGTFIKKSGILQVAGSVLVVMLLMSGVFIPFFLGLGVTVAFSLVKGAVYYIVIISLLLPFINIFVTLASARETAKFFSVDVNYMAFLKII